MCTSLMLCAWCRTLFSNQALCVNADFVYLKVKDPATGRCYIVAEARLGELPGAVPKPGKKGKDGAKSAPTPGFQVCLRAADVLLAAIDRCYVVP